MQRAIKSMCPTSELTLAMIVLCHLRAYVRTHSVCLPPPPPLSRAFSFFTIAKNCNKFYSTYVAVKIIFITLFYSVGGRKNNILVSSVLSVMILRARHTCVCVWVLHSSGCTQYTRRRPTQCIRMTSNKSLRMESSLFSNNGNNRKSG